MAAELVLGNVFIRRNCGYAKGQVCPGHPHAFDHVTFVTRGAFRIDRTFPDGRQQSVTIYGPGHPQYDGRWFVLILAECVHELTALEPNSDFFCVYAHRDPQGRVLQHYDGWEGAYL